MKKCHKADHATIVELRDAYKQAVAERDVARENARTAWSVHREHVDMMNPRLLHAHAVADDWQCRAEKAVAERDRARDLAAHLDDEIARHLDDEPARVAGPDGPRCDEHLGYGWQDPCTCRRPRGHAGLHACEHGFQGAS